MPADREEPTAVARPLERGEQIRSWRVERLLGADAGLCSVYEVSAASGLATLELVPLRVGPTPELSRRFRRLLRIRSSLQHPNLLPVVDGGEGPLGLWVVSEACAEPTLQVLLRQGPLEAGRATLIMAQVADALDAAAKNGLLHAELTPAAIRIDAGDHVLLGDFGIARLALGGPRIELPEYLSPEELRAEPPSIESSVYAFACILLECLTGAPPFRFARPEAVAYAHLTDDPPSPRELRPELPAELDDVLSTGLAKEREQRYSSPGELMRAAAAALGIGPRVEPAPTLDAAHAREALERVRPRAEPPPAPPSEEPAVAPPAAEPAVPAPAAEPPVPPPAAPPPAAPRVPPPAVRPPAATPAAPAAAAGERRPSPAAALAGVLLVCAALGGLAGWALGGAGNDESPKVDQAAQAGATSAEQQAWLARANAAFYQLGGRREAARRRLTGARSGRAQAETAAALARAFDDTTRALANPPGAREQALRQASARAAAGYRQLASAARGGSRLRWSAAQRAVRQAEELLARAAQGP
jgi:serine/threonine kinase PknH